MTRDRAHRASANGELPAEALAKKFASVSAAELERVLRIKKAQEVQALRAQKAELEGRIREINAQLLALGGLDGPSRAAPADRPRRRRTGGSGPSLAAALLTFMEGRKGQIFSASDLREWMVNTGFPAGEDSRAFSASLNAALSRLSKGENPRIKREGRGRYVMPE